MKYPLQKGFSLVELIIAMAVFAIGLSIVVPNFQRYMQNTNLNAAARAITSEIYNLKEKAVSDNLNYRLDFDDAANRYTIMRESGSGTGVYNPSGSGRLVSEFGQGVRIKEAAAFGSGPNLSIYTRGTLEPGHLVLVNSLGSEIRINTVITGRVYVKKTLQ